MIEVEPAGDNAGLRREHADDVPYQHRLPDTADSQVVKGPATIVRFRVDQSLEIRDLFQPGQEVSQMPLILGTAVCQLDAVVHDQHRSLELSAKRTHK